MNHIVLKGGNDSNTVYDSERTKIPKVSLPWLGGNDDQANSNFLDIGRRISPSNMIKVIFLVCKNGHNVLKWNRSCDFPVMELTSTTSVI